MFNRAALDRPRRAAPFAHVAPVVAISWGCLAVSCSAPVPAEPSTLAAEAAEIGRSVMGQTNASVRFMRDEDGPMGTLSQGLSLIEQMFTDAVPTPRLLKEEEPAKAALAQEDATGGADMLEGLDALATGFPMWLRERLLSPLNLVEDTEGVATYRLKADPTCRPLKLPGEDEPPMNAACGRTLAELPLWVSLASSEVGIKREVGATLRFAAGEKKIEFAKLEIRFDHITLQLDFKGQREMAAAINVLVAALLPAAGKLESISGKLAVVIAKRGTTGSSLTVSVEDKLDVAYLRPVKPGDKSPSAAAAEQRAFSVAPASPLVSVTSDGKTQQLALQVDVAAADIQMPVSGATGNAPPALLSARLQGLQAGLELVGEERALRFIGVRISGYSEKIAGKESFRFALNDAGKTALDANVVIDGDGLPHITLASDVNAKAHYPLPGEVAAQDEVTLAVNTLGAEARLSAVTRDRQFAGFALIAGKLVLASPSKTSDIELQPGNCIGRKSIVHADEHPLLGHLVAGPCPRQ